jgi:hypothetical protein
VTTRGIPLVNRRMEFWEETTLQEATIHWQVANRDCASRYTIFNIGPHFFFASSSREWYRFIYWRLNIDRETGLCLKATLCLAQENTEAGLYELITLFIRQSWDKISKERVPNAPSSTDDDRHFRTLVVALTVND